MKARTIATAAVLAVLLAGGAHAAEGIAGRFAIVFWDDFADRHVKIMDVAWADDVT